MSAISEVTIASSAESSASSGDNIGSGELTYNMSIAAGNVGGNSVITITPNHNIPGIGAR